MEPAPWWANKNYERMDGQKLCYIHDRPSQSRRIFYGTASGQSLCKSRFQLVEVPLFWMTLIFVVKEVEHRLRYECTSC
jgi:hypothetical protein